MRGKFFLFIMLLTILTACAEESVSEEGMEIEEETVSVSFRNLDIQVEGRTFILTGEVQTSAQNFYYEIKQGDEEILGEQTMDVSDKDTRWVSFKVKEEIPEEASLAEEAPIITLYGKDKTDTRINPNYIPIDIGIR